MELFNSLIKEIRASRKQHQEAVMRLLRQGSIEDLRFQGGYIQALFDLESKAEQLRSENFDPVPATALDEDR